MLILAIIGGIIVGFSLGLFGSGGSILAVPFLLYVVGIEDPHTAIGTSALSVASIAVITLVFNVKKKKQKRASRSSLLMYVDLSKPRSKILLL